MPTVSVIVPNYNHARFLPRRLESILQQTYQDFELILLDDCSTDDSRSVLSQYADDPRVKMEFNGTNSGSTFKQWSMGVRLASGKYVWIAESDDYADRRLLGRLVEALEADASVAYAYCRSWIVDESENKIDYADAYYKYPGSAYWKADSCCDGKEDCRHRFIYNNVVSNASSAVFRRSVWDRVGGVDETMRTSGDWKLWAAMALTGKVAYVAEALNFYRMHDSTVRSRAATPVIIAEQLEAIRWVADRTKPEEAELKEACEKLSRLWVPVVMSLRVPQRTRMKILKSVIGMDHNLWRHVAGPALLTLRLKVSQGVRALYAASAGGRA